MRECGNAAKERYPICRSDQGALSGVPRESVPTSVDGENLQPRARVFVEALNLKNNALYISYLEFFRRRRPRGPNRKIFYFALRSKAKGQKRTGPKLDRDRSGPFCGTDGLSSVRSTNLRSVFGLPYAQFFNQMV